MGARSTALLGAFALLVLLPPGDAAAIDDVVHNPNNDHYYKRYTELVTWKVAKTNAEDVGGYLATITSSAEDNWVRNNVAGAGGWLGATDEVSEGTWAWVTNETWSYTTWNSGEPNNASNAEHYLEYGGAGGWNDEPNTDTQNANAYIVEWDKNPNITTPPDAPSNLTATAINERRVDLAWADPGDIESDFELERSTAGGAFSLLTKLGEDVTSFTDTAVVAETDYTYRVRATNEIGASGYSNTADVTTPQAPLGGLEVMALSNTSVEVTWLDQTDAETAIEVERALGCPGINFARIASLQPDTTAYVDSGLSPETVYSYRLRAITAAGPAEYTPEACLTTPPRDPNTVARSAVSDTEVTLSWVDASDNETGFEVERGLGCPGAGWVLLATLPPNTTTYTDVTATPETTFAYRVRAISAEGGSDWTPEVCVTMPPFAPTAPVAQALSGSRVRVTWSDVSSVEEGYEVMRAPTDTGSFVSIADLPPGTTEFEDAAAGQETGYAYRVAAYDGHGHSGWAVAADVETLAVLFVQKAVVKRAKGKKPARLSVSGEFDADPNSALAAAATLTVASTPFVIPGFTAKGPTLRHVDDGIQLKLLPSRKGSSRVVFKLVVAGDAAAALDADGDLTLGFVQGTYAAVGTVRLAKDKYVGGKLGHPVDPAVTVKKLSARLKGGPKDALKILGFLHDADGVPAQAPDVVVAFGFFEFTAAGDQFIRKGDTWIFQQKLLGNRKVVLDYAKGRVAISLTGIELGTYAQGPTRIHFAIDVGDLHFEDTPVLAVGKGGIGY